MQKQLDDLKERICLKYWTEEDHAEAEDAAQLEQCYVKVKNHREDAAQIPLQEVASPTRNMTAYGKTPVNPATKKIEEPVARPETSMTANSIAESYVESEMSNPDDVPHHIRFISAAQPEFNMIVQHSEAVLQVRKYLISEAVKTFPQYLANDSCIRELQITIHQRQRQIEKKFEEFLLTQMGYGTGEAFEDKNLKILYKTFLQAPKRKMQGSVSTRSMHLSHKSSDYPGAKSFH